MAIGMTNAATITADCHGALGPFPSSNSHCVQKKAPAAADQRTMFGAVVAAVARKFVPNCSAAIVTKTAQYPQANPMHVAHT